MLCSRLLLPCCLLLAVVIAGCSKSPTSPTRTADTSQVVIGGRPEVMVVPPAQRLTVTPPRGVGLTRFVAFGDSITWGAQSAFDPRFLFAAANGGYPERLQAGLNTFHPPQQFVVFNEGVPGEWASDPRTAPRLRNAIISRQAQAVLLLEGINDLNNSNGISRTISGLAQLVTTAQSLGVPVIIATMFQTYQSVGPDGVVRPNAASEVPAFNAQIRQLAAGRPNVHLVDLEPRMRDRSLVGNDGLHPTDQGFAIIASSFMAAIETAFPVRGSIQ